MNETVNFKLKKPESNEYVNVQDLNDNCDIVDAEMKKHKDAIDKHYAAPILVVLKASDWSGDAAPYSQTSMVEGITDADEPMMVSVLSDRASETVQKAYMKAYGIVASGTATTGNGAVTFRAYKKPVTDITVGLKF